MDAVRQPGLVLSHRDVIARLRGCFQHRGDFLLSYPPATDTGTQTRSCRAYGLRGSPGLSHVTLVATTGAVRSLTLVRCDDLCS